MKAASAPRPWTEIRILVVDGASGAMRVASSADLASLFAPGDLLVVNDAATLPASLRGRTTSGEAVELRLVAASSERRWTAALFGSGDFRTRTEDRPPPPRVRTGDRLLLGEGLVPKPRNETSHEARQTGGKGQEFRRPRKRSGRRNSWPHFGRAELVADVLGLRPESTRLLEIELAIAERPDASLAETWAALYRAGRPVQYAHVPEPLSLWDIQNVYAARPWAVEMPSAGRALRIEALLDLRRRGIEVASVTHAAGLSSLGDPAIDALLPLPERYEVTEETWEAIARTRRRGGRVVAIGTSAARALEGGARAGKPTGVTDLRIGPGMRRAIVDAVLTGVHEADTSHFALLGAFTSPAVLERALARAESEGLLGHEMGDACLVWGEPREKLAAPRGKTAARARESGRTQL